MQVKALYKLFFANHLAAMHPIAQLLIRTNTAKQLERNKLMTKTGHFTLVYTV